MVTGGGSLEANCDCYVSFLDFCGRDDNMVCLDKVQDAECAAEVKVFK